MGIPSGVRDVLDREIDTARAVIPKPHCYRASTRSAGDPRHTDRTPATPVDMRIGHGRESQGMVLNKRDGIIRSMVR